MTNITNIVNEKTFSLDETKPQLDTFETEYCLDEKCFIANKHPTKISLSFIDLTATFFQEKIFFLIGSGNSQRVADCTGNSCEGIYTDTSCQSGERIQAKLGTAFGLPSSDDAENSIEG